MDELHKTLIINNGKDKDIHLKMCGIMAIYILRNSDYIERPSKFFRTENLEESQSPSFWS